MAATGQGGEAAQQAQGQNGGGEGEGGGEQQGAPDFSGLSSQLEQMAGGMEEMRQFLTSNQFQQQQQQGEQPAEQQAPPEVDLSWLDPADPGYDPEQMSQKMTEAFGQYVNQAIEQSNAPLQERLQEMQRETAAERLVSEFPDLQQQDVAEEVVKAAHEYAGALGQPELGNDPSFWRLVYLSGRAIDAAQKEGSGDPGAAHVEGGGGAVSGATSVDPADEIMNAGGKKGSGVLPF